MRRLLVILLFAANSFLGTSISKTSQTNYKNLSEVSKTIEVISTNLIGYNYLKEEYGIHTYNIPTGMPLDSNGLHRISELYGVREKHPILGYRTTHRGIDFSGNVGTEIYASADGVVEKVTYSASYGKHIVIDHGNNVKTKYAHLNSTEVKVGQQIEKGECIAELGNTGMSTGPHLHFEVIVNSKPIDPTLLLFGRSSKDKGDIISEMCNQKTFTNGNKNFKYTTGQINRSGDRKPVKGHKNV